STDGIWSGNLYDFWQSVYGRLRQAVPRPFRLDGEARRMDENPMEITIREALTNAIVHADYMGRRGTVIIRRQSTIEFTNPGRLRVTKAEAEQGGISDARNPILMKMFFLIGIGEKAGSGFDVMRAGCDSVGAPHPLLEVLTRPDRVKLVVRYTNLGGSVMTPANNESMKSWTSVGHLSKSESEALQYLVSQGSISTSELAEHMELGVSRARALLKSLVEDGFAQSRGRGRATRYEPVEGLPVF
ncbi:ATP-binding protein, partial [Bifidobacterium longum]|nr:ATP-binding protein [Bifidobacterium longum]